MEVLEAQGYQRYCAGQVLVAPALTSLSGGARATMVTTANLSAQQFSAAEMQLLADHAAFGCLVLLATRGARQDPFVFQARRGRFGLPHARLVWCRQIIDFHACAGAIGRMLLRRGLPLILLDADGPLPGLPGLFTAAPKYFKGPLRPRLGDLAYSEYPVLNM